MENKKLMIKLDKITHGVIWGILLNIYQHNSNVTSTGYSIGDYEILYDKYCNSETQSIDLNDVDPIVKGTELLIRNLSDDDMLSLIEITKLQCLSLVKVLKEVLKSGDRAQIDSEDWGYDSAAVYK
jgi:hypothetical protein